MIREKGETTSYEILMVMLVMAHKTLSLDDTFGAELRAPTALEESVLRIVSIILQLASKPLAWPYSQIPRKYISASKPKYVHLGSRKLVQTRFRFDKIGIVC